MASRLSVLAALSLVLSLSTGCISVSVGPQTGRAKLTEEVIEPSDRFWSFSKVAVITLSGTINGNLYHTLMYQDSAVSWVKDQLDRAEEDSDVRAVVLRIDSPGGEVTASDVIYREICRFRRERNIPVFVSMMDIAASGGYYVAMAGDRVYAHPTTITGSIGVIATLPQLEGLTRKIGVEMRVVKSGPSKDLGSIWRAFEPGEREIFQGIIDSMYGRFLAVVAEGRPNLPVSRIRQLADGRVFTAEQALAEGLIDGVKYLDEVIEEAKVKAELKSAAVVMYRRPSDYKGHIYAQQKAPAPQALLHVDVGDLAERLSQPRFQYLWAPGW
jgi:protease-4